MRALATFVLLALGAAVAAAAGKSSAEVIPVQWGGSGAGTGGARDGALGAGPTPIPRSPPPGAAALDRDRDRDGEWLTPDEGASGAPDDGPDGKPDRRHGHRDRNFRRKLPFFFDDDDDEERIIIVPMEPRERPEEAAPAEPPPPPDPRGPRFVPARGAALEPRYTVGEPLPAGVPFVTLDWSQYELPEPPPGLAYARIGGDVVLIDPATRVVERRIEPSELGPGQGAPGSG